MAPTACSYLVSGRPAKDRSHELRGLLTSFCCLAAQLAIDSGQKRNIGNNQRPWRQHVRSELALKDLIKLPHAIPLLGRRQIRACDRRAKGRDDDIRQLSV